MGVTMKDIAERAGVSVATVSFALNHTRYVESELLEKIRRAADEMGYVRKNSKKRGGYHVGKFSEIALVVPDTYSSFYSNIITVISKYIAKEGYLLSTHLTDENPHQEQHILNEIITNRRIAGIILSPVCEEGGAYEKLKDSGIPFICLERTLTDEQVDSVLSDNERGIYRGTEHLVKCGHENIAILLGNHQLSTSEERRKGYQEALEHFHIPYRKEMVRYINLEEEIQARNVFRQVMKKLEPTAVIAAGNTLTRRLIKAIGVMDVEYPANLSIVGYGDDEWCELTASPLTTLKQNTVEIGRRAAEWICKKIVSDISREKRKKGVLEKVPMELIIRNSTQNIARGPFGERSVYPEEMILSDEDTEKLRKDNYKVAVSFHYSGDEWTRLHERAIVETLNSYGIHVMSVADAHFEPELQNTQLEGIIMQKPDAVIAVPTDEEKTAKKFKEISAKTKLILINSMPKGFEQKDYVCWISVNERENGQNAAKILGDYFERRDSVKVGILAHGTPYFATNQRDFFAEQILNDNYSNIEVASRENFYSIENTYEVCKKMLEKHPEIQGLYISWERPALEAIKALKDLGRTEVVVSTCDLDYEIASYMAKKEIVIGLSSQRPYEQGVAVAIATAKALIGKCETKCIGVLPYLVQAEKLDKAWRDLTKTKLPKFG